MVAIIGGIEQSNNGPAKDRQNGKAGLRVLTTIARIGGSERREIIARPN